MLFRLNEKCLFSISRIQLLCKVYNPLDSRCLALLIKWSLFHVKVETTAVSTLVRVKNEDSTSNFEGLLIKSNSISVHQRNILLLLLEIYKAINNLNPSFMAEVFVTNVVPYNLRGRTNLVLPKA